MKYGFTVVFYRHCGEGWGWSGKKAGKNPSDINVAQGDAQNVAQIDKIDRIIFEEIRKNNKVTREEMAKVAGVSKKTIERRLKLLSNINYVGRGNNGHWEIKE